MIDSNHSNNLLFYTGGFSVLKNLKSYSIIVACLLGSFVLSCIAANQSAQPDLLLGVQIKNQYMHSKNLNKQVWQRDFIDPINANNLAFELTPGDVLISQPETIELNLLKVPEHGGKELGPFLSHPTRRAVYFYSGKIINRHFADRKTLFSKAKGNDVKAFRIDDAFNIKIDGLEKTIPLSLYNSDYLELTKKSKTEYRAFLYFSPQWIIQPGDGILTRVLYYYRPARILTLNKRNTFIYFEGLKRIYRLSQEGFPVSDDPNLVTLNSKQKDILGNVIFGDLKYSCLGEYSRSKKSINKPVMYSLAQEAIAKKLHAPVNSRQTKQVLMQYPAIYSCFNLKN